MTDLLLQPLSAAFLDVGVFVALMLVGFGYLRYRFGHRLLRFLGTRWRSAPLFGAVLGVVPGCGGAIIVMPLYLRGTVSFGTVVAALVATMGDASFVLIAIDPGLALALHGALLLCGIVSGYAVDALGIAPPRRTDAPHESRALGASVGAAEAIPPPRASRAAHVALTPLGVLPRTFWGLWVGGFALTVPLTFGLTDGEALARVLAGVDPTVLLGVAGTVCAVALHLTRGRHATPDLEAAGSAVEVLRQAAGETAFVTTWVAAAYLTTTWVIAGTGVDLGMVAAATGIAGVIVGALIGLIPGCAPQVLLTGLHATGAVPIPTLVANAASQDGDALFPLLVLDRQAALLAAVLSTLPAVVLGGVWLWLA